MRLFKRKPQIIKVAHLEPSSESVIFDVENLDFLKKNFRKIYESPQAFYGNNDDGVFRFKKSNFKPVFFKAETMELDPSTTSIYVNLKALMELAEKYDVEIWELTDRYVIVGPGMNWFAAKHEEQECSRRRHRK